MKLRSISAKPVLKWAGGKQSIAEHLIKHFPAFQGTFYEPFVGGASVLVTLGPKKAVVADLNSWLIDTYTAIREDWRKVASILDNLVNTREEFERIRAIRPDGLDQFHRAAHLVYLNKTCFRGLYRVNRRNQFNVPYGAYDRRYYDPENFEAFASILANVEILRADFEVTAAPAKKQDFVYFDPPYYKFGGFSDFNRYTQHQFREIDHKRLAAVCRKLDEQGVRWAVSNSKTSFVKRLFDGFFMTEVSARREINLKSQDRDIAELLVTNYDPKREGRLEAEPCLF